MLRLTAALGTALILSVIAVASASGRTATDAARTTSVTSLVTPKVLRGSGSRVLSIRVPSGKPLVVSGTHTGSSNFIVHLVGPTEEFVFNEIGRYGGQVVIDEPRAGRYRVAVQADGPWELKFAQPVPYSGAIRVPGTIRSRGTRVVQVRATSNMQPVVSATHAGESNFIVHLVGIGSTRGTEFLFNEIGRYRGETLLRSMPRGNYLLAVQGDGAWSIKFAR